MHKTLQHSESRFVTVNDYMGTKTKTIILEYKRDGWNWYGDSHRPVVVGSLYTNPGVSTGPTHSYPVTCTQNFLSHLRSHFSYLTITVLPKIPNFWTDPRFCLYYLKFFCEGETTYPSKKSPENRDRESRDWGQRTTSYPVYIRNSVLLPRMYMLKHL